MYLSVIDVLCRIMYMHMVPPDIPTGSSAVELCSSLEAPGCSFQNTAVLMFGLLFVVVGFVCLKYLHFPPIFLNYHKTQLLFLSPGSRLLEPVLQATPFPFIFQMCYRFSVGVFISNITWAASVGPNSTVGHAAQTQHSIYVVGAISKPPNPAA